MSSVQQNILRSYKRQLQALQCRLELYNCKEEETSQWKHRFIDINTNNSNREIEDIQQDGNFQNEVTSTYYKRHSKAQQSVSETESESSLEGDGSTTSIQQHSALTCYTRHMPTEDMSTKEARGGEQSNLDIKYDDTTLIDTAIVNNEGLSKVDDFDYVETVLWNDTLAPALSNRDFVQFNSCTNFSTAGSEISNISHHESQSHFSSNNIPLYRNQKIHKNSFMLNNSNNAAEGSGNTNVTIRNRFEEPGSIFFHQQYNICDKVGLTHEESRRPYRKLYFNVKGDYPVRESSVIIPTFVCYFFFFFSYLQNKCWCWFVILFFMVRKCCSLICAG